MRDEFSSHHGLKLLAGFAVLAGLSVVAGIGVVSALKDVTERDLDPTANERLGVLEHDGAMRPFLPEAQEVTEERGGRCTSNRDELPRVRIVYRTDVDGFTVLDAFNRQALDSSWALVVDPDADGTSDSVDYEKDFGKGENAWTGQLSLSITELDDGKPGFAVTARAFPSGCDGDDGTTTST